MLCFTRLIHVNQTKLRQAVIYRYIFLDMCFIFPICRSFIDFSLNTKTAHGNSDVRLNFRTHILRISMIAANITGYIMEIHSFSLQTSHKEKVKYLP